MFGGSSFPIRIRLPVRAYRQLGQGHIEFAEQRFHYIPASDDPFLSQGNGLLQDLEHFLLGATCGVVEEHDASIALKGVPPSVHCRKGFGDVIPCP